METVFTAHIINRKTHQIEDRPATLKEIVHRGRRMSKSDFQKSFSAPRGLKTVVSQYMEPIFQSREYSVSSNSFVSTLQGDPLDRSLEERFQARLREIGWEQILKRGLSRPAFLNKPDLLRVASRVRGERLWLLHGEGWYKYSGPFGSRYQTASYLCGCEDGHYWAVRVPGTITTVDQAELWLMPAPVRKEHLDGQNQVWRQGDMYFIPQPSGRHCHDLSALHGTRHHAEVVDRVDVGVVVTHPEHSTLNLPSAHYYRVYQQTQLNGAGRVAGD